MDADVLVVGAGPTGLTLAVALAQLGVSVVVVESTVERDQRSKALVIQPRALEALDALGCGPEIAERSQPLAAMSPRNGGRDLFRLEFEPTDGPHSAPVMLRQHLTEATLEARLRALGVQVRRGVTVEGFEDRGDRVVVRCVAAEGTTTLEARYLCGCGGAHSVVRKQLGILFDGVAYHNDFLQVDARMDWSLPCNEASAFVCDDGMMVVIPLEDDLMRLIRFRYHRPEDAPDEPPLEVFQAELDRWGPPGSRLHDPVWRVRFRLNDRLAARYRVGRAFLVGDAAHIHTPLGGQGMNTGMSDATNLAWKLAWVLQGHSSDALLDSYEAERRPVAAQVLRFTGLGFRSLLVSAGEAPWRRNLFLAVAARLMSWRWVRRRIVGRVTQLDVDVAHGRLGLDDRWWPRRPGVGQRAPDAVVGRPSGESSSLHALLRDGRGFVLLFGRHPESVCQELAERLTVIAVGEAWVDVVGQVAARYRPRASEVIVVRPDGVVGARVESCERALAWVSGL